MHGKARDVPEAAVGFIWPRVSGGLEAKLEPSVEARGDVLSGCCIQPSRNGLLGQKISRKVDSDVSDVDGCVEPSALQAT